MANIPEKYTTKGSLNGGFILEIGSGTLTIFATH
jgi:hypothetical protein